MKGFWFRQGFWTFPWIPWPPPLGSPSPSSAPSSASPPPFPLASSPASSPTASPNTSTPPLSASPSLTSPSVSPPTSTTSSPCFSVTPPCFSTVPDAASSLSSSDSVTSLAVNYNDGLLKEEGLCDAQKNYRLIKLPSLIEYVGYCLCCGTHFAGLVYEMKEYLHWAKGKGIMQSLQQ